MARKAVMDAVAARLAANWTLTTIIEDDTDGQATGDGSPYVTLEYPVATETQITVGAPGNNVFREEGSFRIVLVSPTGQGKDQPILWIDQIRAIFRSVKFSGVTTFAPSPGVVDNSNYRAGKFVVTSAVPYQANFFG